MASVKLTAVQGLPGGGNPPERGFAVSIDTAPVLEVARVTVVWTPDRWSSVNYTACRISTSSMSGDKWIAEVSFRTFVPTTFLFAIAALGPNGLDWDNNGSQNHTVVH